MNRERFIRENSYSFTTEDPEFFQGTLPDCDVLRDKQLNDANSSEKRSRRRSKSVGPMSADRPPDLLDKSCHNVCKERLVRPAISPKPLIMAKPKHLTATSKPAISPKPKFFSENLPSAQLQSNMNVPTSSNMNLLPSASSSPILKNSLSPTVVSNELPISLLEGKLDKSQANNHSAVHINSSSPKKNAQNQLGKLSPICPANLLNNRKPKPQATTTSHNQIPATPSPVPRHGDDQAGDLQDGGPDNHEFLTPAVASLPSTPQINFQRGAGKRDSKGSSELRRRLSATALERINKVFSKSSHNNKSDSSSRSVFHVPVEKEEHLTSERSSFSEVSNPSSPALSDIPSQTYPSFSGSEEEFGIESCSDDSDIDEETVNANIESLESDKELEGTGQLHRSDKIIEELLKTEVEYVNVLYLLDQVFQNNIITQNRNFKMLPDGTIPQIFSNIKSIHSFHKDFLLPKLRKRWNEWRNRPQIGDLMLYLAPFLKLYIEYVTNLDHAMHRLSELKSENSRFRELIEELETDERCQRLQLQHHMLGPIQRIPRYELLLKDYLKHLPENSTDIEDTEKALALVKKAAVGSNDAMSKLEAFRKVIEVQEKMGDGTTLVSPTRKLLHEGKIIKISARNGQEHDRYIFLFNDLLLICQSYFMGLNVKYRVKAQLEMEGMEIQEATNLETPDTFIVKSKQKTIELKGGNVEHKHFWHVALLTAVADFTRHRISIVGESKSLQSFECSDLGKKAPEWVKDQSVSVCMNCAAEFTRIRRKHHCRACGKVICGKCSGRKYSLEFDNFKFNRICDTCFAALSGGRVKLNRSLNDGLQAGGKQALLNIKATDESIIRGYLHMSSDRKNWSRRWFAAHSNFVLYTFKADQDIKALTSLPLPGYTVASIPSCSPGDDEFVMKIYHRHQKKAYYLQAETQARRNRWIYVLSKLVAAELPEQSQIDSFPMTLPLKLQSESS